MLILRDMGGDTLYGESAVLDAIGIPTHYCTKVCVICLSIVQVRSTTVVTKNNILGMAILVWDKEVCKSGTVRYEACVDARRRDCVLSEDTCTARVLSQSSERERRQSNKRGDHVVEELCALREAGFDKELDVEEA